MSKFKKRLAAMMSVSVLTVWFALPNVAYAQTVTIEGRSIHTNLSGNSDRATVTASYVEGSGQLKARVTGNVHSLLAPNVSTTVIGPEVSNPTPGGVSASVNAPDGWELKDQSYSECWYKIYINDILHSGVIVDYINL